MLFAALVGCFGCYCVLRKMLVYLLVSVLGFVRMLFVLWFCECLVSFAVSVICGVDAMLDLCLLWLFIVGYGCCLLLIVPLTGVVNSVGLVARFYSVWIVAYDSTCGVCIVYCVFGFDCCLICGGYFCMVLKVGVA